MIGHNYITLKTWGFRPTLNYCVTIVLHFDYFYHKAFTEAYNESTSPVFKNDLMNPRHHLPDKPPLK